MASRCKPAQGYNLNRPRWRLAVLCALFISASGNALETRELLDMSLEDLLKIPITGSHIKRADASAIGFVSIIDRDTIQRSGATTVEILLQRLVVSAGYAGNQTNTYWAANGNGSTHVNLRGLGINRTLVLLNGRRLAGGGTGANAAVDLNGITLATIDRIEILKDGASAIYGADAVAGVVNIITRSDLVGFEGSVRVGESFDGDGNNRSADLAWGINNEHGSLMLSLNRSANSAVNMADRAACGLGEVGSQLVCVNSGNTIGGRALLADGQQINFNQVLGGNGDFFEPYSATKHNFNYNPYLNAVNPNGNTSLSAFGNLLLNDKLSTFTELSYSERHSDQLASPGIIGLNRPIQIAANHPTNPTGQDLLLQRRRLLEAGPRHFLQDVKTFDSVLGMKGRLEDNWDWSASLSYRRNTGVDEFTNVVNLDKVENTLNTSLCSTAAGASIPCADYLGYGDLTPAVIDYLMLTAQDKGGNEQKGFSASITGQALALPAGPLAIAAGIEIRANHGWRDPDPLAVTGVANVNLQKPTEGEFTAREVFTEVNIPLLSQLPWAKSLKLSSAIRYSDYDLFGDVTNYKLGLEWQVQSGFTLRTNYATAFRAPNIPELFAGSFTQNLNANDPCSNWSNLPTTSEVYRNCQAEGVPAGFQQLVPTILTTQGGNPNLKPEQAKTFTFGAIWKPSETLEFSLDYFNIDIEDAIGGAGGTTKLAACYNSQGMTHPFCDSSQFTRNQITGQINYLSIQQVNAASEKMSGIDFGAHYQFSLMGWNSQLNWDVSYLRNYDLLPFKDAAQIHYAGNITSGRGSYTHWRSLGSLTMERGLWSGTYGLQYIGSAHDMAAPKGTIGATVPSKSYHNIQAQYAHNKSLIFSAGIDNLWDAKAPYMRNWIDANTDTMTYDMLGRRWFLKSTYRW